MRKLLFLSLAASSLCACSRERPQEPARAAAPDASTRAALTFDQVDRAEFNRVALTLDLPLFWTADANRNRALDPAELAVFWGLRPEAKLADFVDGGRFTNAFEKAYASIADRAKKGPDFGGLPEEEKARRQLVIDELAQGRQTLIRSDLRDLPPEEKRFVQAIVDASAIIERLYHKQLGIFGLRDRISKDDPQSRAMLWRNQDFRCQAPKTQGNPRCSALSNPPEGKQSGLYPAKPLQAPGFCETLARSDKLLADPFTVVVEGPDGALAAKPYHEVWAEDMRAVSNLLSGAARAFPEGKEEALKAYLNAAAQGFLDDNWVPADEAWAKMNVNNSRWYLRIGPDEVYAEPCSTKALFHTSFGRINQGSVKWQSLLDPLKGEMEAEIARLSGPPYKPRKVTFHLPDFMDVVLNAADSRDASGATIGQSLPNFGPVANEGRGRTVAMVNISTDPDSLEVLRQGAESLFCASVMPRYTTDPEALLVNTLLHEAAHNLGPSHQYAVKGKIDRQVFGGPLASTMEELKAQTAGLMYVDWLAKKGVLPKEQADRVHVRDLQWVFGHISRGMYDDEKHPRTYSQLSAMQLGMLMSHGAVTWNAEENAANGKDKGCFAMDFEKLPAAITEMMKRVGGIKARGDRAGAEKLVKDYVDGSGPAKDLHPVITERMLRSPRASFVYAIELE